MGNVLIYDKDTGITVLLESHCVVCIRNLQ